MNWYKPIKLAEPFLTHVHNHADAIRTWWLESEGNPDMGDKLPEGFHFEPTGDNRWDVVGPDNFVIVASEPTLRHAKGLAIIRLKTIVHFTTMATD